MPRLISYAVIVQQKTKFHHAPNNLAVSHLRYSSAMPLRRVPVLQPLRVPGQGFKKKKKAEPRSWLSSLSLPPQPRQRTCASTRVPSPRIAVGPSCTRVQFRGREGRRGWGLSASSRWTVGLWQGHLSAKQSRAQFGAGQPTYLWKWSTPGSTGLAECLGRCCRWS